MSGWGMAEFLLASTLRVVPPILLAGLAGLLSMQVGMLNIALEGMLLVGAFVGVLFSFLTGSGLAGLVAATLIGAATGYLFAVFNLKFRANNIVVGVAVNILALGLTTYLLRTLFGVRGAFSSPRIGGLPLLHLPFLEGVPLLRAVAHLPVMTYVAVAAVVAVHLFLYHTPIGLRVQATGQYPLAVTTAGASVDGLKLLVLVVGGAFAGAGGAHLSLGQLTMFTENMSNGRGFMAVAVAVFGRRTPLGTLGAALLFGLAETATMWLQSFSVPPQLVQLIPYVLTILVLVLVAVRERAEYRRAQRQALTTGEQEA